MKFLFKNYKGLIYPLIILSILFFDQIIFQIPLIITLLKLFCFSILHYLYVLKTDYIYDSDIYRYLTDLKIELEKNYIIKPFLSPIQSTIIFWSLLTLLCFPFFFW
jgi:hypothetical protein